MKFGRTSIPELSRNLSGLANTHACQVLFLLQSRTTTRATVVDTSVRGKRVKSDTTLQAPLAVWETPQTPPCPPERKCFKPAQTMRELSPMWPNASLRIFMPPRRKVEWEQIMFVLWRFHNYWKVYKSEEPPPPPTMEAHGSFSFLCGW